MDQYLVVAIADLLLGLSVIWVIWLFHSGRLRRWIREPLGRSRWDVQSGRILAVLLILSAAVVITSSFLIENLGVDSSVVKSLFDGSVAQAYVVAVVGVGMLIFHSMPGPAEPLPLLRQVHPPTSSAGPSGLPPHMVPRRLGTGVRTVLYLLSALSPFAGSVAGSILYTRETSEYVHVGRTCLVITSILLVGGGILGTLIYLAM